uniref:ATPase AAA-type core domain-containing protein n=1 Tax=Meloidogyne incognita TaxID=6306 RepID=A0A914KMI7_MELIC
MPAKRAANNGKKTGEENAKKARQKTPDSSSSKPPIKRLRSKSHRKVQFDANPQILEITPLVEKPTGQVRMPEPSKSIEQDFASPAREDELIILLADDSLMGKGVKDENGEDNNSRQSIEIMDASQTFTKPPAVKVKENASKGYRPIPLLQLEEDEVPQQSTENNGELENSLPLMEQHVLNDLEHYAFLKGKSKSASSNRFLWSQLFMPKRQQDFIGKSKADFLQLNEWLEKWYKQINFEKEKNLQENKKKKKKEEENNKRKRRRSSNKFFEEELTDDYEEDEEDNDFEFIVEENMLNPAIICGPTGCGKSVMVYQAAKECKFEVIEISSSSPRDGQSLKQKIAGALENHNVQSRKTSDIRSLFGNNKQSDNFKKNQNDFSLLLIDECDIIYSSDSNFWSTLRQICTESKIPIILTCNDLEYVLMQIGKDFDGNKDDIFVIQMERPSDRLFAQYLRHWYFGFTSHYHKTCSFYNLITIKNKDPRAVLNSLHFWDLDISENDSFSNRRSSSIEREENLSLSECQKRLKILSKLDASFGPGEKKNISILTKCSINLDFNNEEDGFLNNWWTKIEELNELRLEYLDSVDMDDRFLF